MGESRVDDVVQETMVRVHVALRRGDRVRSLGPWLHRIAHNAALNGLRDRAHHNDPLDEELTGGEQPDLAVERGLELRRVVDAVQALPERQREAIVLREGEGRSYGEIASTLEVTDGAVRQLLHRARASLRSGVAAIFPFGPLARLLGSAGDATVLPRVGEACASAAGTGVAAKVCATTLVVAAVAGGGMAVPERHPGNGSVAEAGAARQASPSVRSTGSQARDVQAAPARTSVRSATLPARARSEETGPSGSAQREPRRPATRYGGSRNIAGDRPSGRGDQARARGREQVAPAAEPARREPNARPTRQRELSPGAGSDFQTREAPSGTDSGQTPGDRPG